MKTIDINTWNRKEIFTHFMGLKDPSFALTFRVDVTKAYAFSKTNRVSFFAKYLHDCMRAINEIENFKYRIKDDKVIYYNVIHASATILRLDRTFGFSFINYKDELDAFVINYEQEKKRIQSSQDLYPPINGDNCIHCSAIPWVPFIGHKEPVSGLIESIPELAFSKVETEGDKKVMNIAIRVNHALIDGYHIGEFYKKFQYFLNQ